MTLNGIVSLATAMALGSLCTAHAQNLHSQTCRNLQVRIASLESDMKRARTKEARAEAQTELQGLRRRYQKGCKK